MTQPIDLTGIVFVESVLVAGVNLTDAERGFALDLVGFLAGDDGDVRVASSYVLSAEGLHVLVDQAVAALARAAVLDLRRVVAAGRTGAAT